VKFGVLGPLTASTDDGVPVVIGGARQRTLLAVLLFHANTPVSLTRLVDALWDGVPPKSHLSNLHTYLSRLRDRLGGIQVDHFDGQYRLVLPPRSLDLQIFRGEAEAGRQALALGDPAVAAAHFRTALAQWRDRPLLDLSIPALEADIAQLEVARLNLVEECFDAELAAGRSGDLVGELQAAVARHPTRERLCGQLMTALCGAGRQADALAVYRAARTTLVETLGVEPGPELQQLHEEILRGAPRRTPNSDFPVCQLPPDVADFAGRSHETDAVTNALRANSSTVPVVVLTGEPGVGKTALALHVAHRADFPDGQLFIRLAGASRQPKDPADALAALLRAIGVTGSAIPDDPEERAALFRSKLAGRKVLLVLDDAADPEQVRPLLPGTPGCAVLVTSRSKLSGLVGAQRVPVPPFTDAEARSLLENVVGRARVGAEPGAVSRVVAMCGHLPLALRIAATRLATRPHLRLEFLAKRLTDERRRLDELAISGLQVRASVILSYDGLTANARAVFRRLGLLGPHSIAAWTAAALLDADDVDGELEELVEASLLEPAGVDATGEARYRMHDLLRVFGRERVEHEDDPLTAAKRLVDTALHLADDAARRMPRTFLLSRLNGHRRPGDADPAAWFAAEQTHLVHLVRLACLNGWQREAELLTERLNVPLWSRSEWAEMRTLQELLRVNGDELTRARADFVLTLIDSNRGRYDQVEAGFERCRDAFEKLGDRLGLACTLSNHAHFLALTGEPERSLPHAERAIDLFRADDDGFGEAAARRAAATTLGCLGRLEEALAHSERALHLAEQLDEPRQVGLALSEVAWSRFLLGQLDDARKSGSEAVEVFRTLGERSALANTLYDLGLVEASLGDRDDAVRCFEESGRLAREIDERPLAAAAERGLAAAGVGDTVAVLRRSLDVFREMSAKSEEVITRRLLATALEDRGEQRCADETDELDHVTAVKLRALLALSS
jgi:DNA-binding SARP family transcriptional activator